MRSSKLFLATQKISALLGLYKTPFSENQKKEAGVFSEDRDWNLKEKFSLLLHYEKLKSRVLEDLA